MMKLIYGTLCAGLTLAIAPPTPALELTLLSRPDDPFVFGTQGDHDAVFADCSLSSDGRLVAFTSYATQLVANDRNGQSDIFVKDRVSGAVERISLRADGTEVSELSLDPELSPSGRYVTFVVNEDLFGTLTPVARQIYLYDRTTGNLTLVSKSLSGQPGNDDSRDASFDPTESVLTFHSLASDLVVGDNNDDFDIFVYDLATEQIDRVSVNSAGSEGNGRSTISISAAGGSLVSFDSEASNLVANDTNDLRDVFLRDRAAGLTMRLNMTPAGSDLDQPSYISDIADAGHVVAFATSAAGAVATDTNGASDAFLVDTITGVTTLVSTDASGTQGDGNSFSPRISANGDVVAFRGDSTNLSGNNPDGYTQLFVKHVPTGTIQQLTEDNPGLLNVGDINSAGTYVCFDAAGSQVVIDDRNHNTDFFVANRLAASIERVSTAAQPHPMLAGNGSSFQPDISGDGSRVVLASLAFGLDGEVLAGANRRRQVYLLDLPSGEMTRLTNSIFTGNAAADETYTPAISTDGRYVAFVSEAGDLHASANDGPDVYRVDTLNGAIALITDGSGEVGALAATPDLSDNGEFVVFDSHEDDLVPDDTNQESDVFLWSVATGVERISVNASGEEGNKSSDRPRVSGDAEIIVFDSSASNLVSDDTNGRGDVFVFDRTINAIERVSVNVNGIEGSDTSSQADISGDGRYVTFQSLANDLVANDLDAGADIFLVDRELDTITRITEGLAGLGLLDPNVPRISRDGRTIVFYAVDLLGNASLIRYDRSTDSLQLLLEAEDRAFPLPPTGYAITDDGRTIVVDWLDRLVDEDANRIDASDVYGIQLDFGQLQFVEADNPLPEDSGTMVFSVQRIGGTDGVLRVDYEVVAGTATIGDDVLFASGTLEWGDSVAHAMPIEITLIDDGVPENTEQFDVRLSNARGGATLTTDTLTISIIDDDETPVFQDGFE